MVVGQLIIMKIVLLPPSAQALRILLLTRSSGRSRPVLPLCAPRVFYNSYSCTQMMKVAMWNMHDHFKRKERKDRVALSPPGSGSRVCVLGAIKWWTGAQEASLGVLSAKGAAQRVSMYLE